MFKGESKYKNVPQSSPLSERYSLRHMPTFARKV